MSCSPRLLAILLSLSLSAALAQTGTDPVAPALPNQDPSKSDTAPAKADPEIANSAMGAETFYEVLLGEMNVLASEPAAGFSLMLNAARKANDAQLYQRAVELALQSRSGEAALLAARAWHQAQPLSREANRAVLQILLALNRLGDSLGPLKTELAIADKTHRSQAITAIPRSYLQASDKKLAASIVEQAMLEYTSQPATAAAAWAAIGQMRLGAEDLAGALDAARRGHNADAAATAPVALALDLMERKQPAAETLVRQHLDQHPSIEARMGYARVLTDLRRYAEAIAQLKLLNQDKPDFAESWLLLGTLQLQENQPEAAERALLRFVELAQPDTASSDIARQARTRALTQAYLSLAQIAEERKDYPGAEAWIARIDNAQDLVRAQSRRASLLARQGKLEQARELLQTLPEKDDADIRLKATAEAQLLRDNKRHQEAYDVLESALGKLPQDADLLYEQAMVAEKLNRLDDMERLLRKVIELKPDYHHAYNALGYSLADRNVRLPEAKQLILKALEAAPEDPFIQDSLAWAEFRMGNKAEALKILEAAFKARPDVEIATHLGEVLWSLGQRSKAIAVWKEGLRMGRDNEALQETLKRLRVPM